MSESQRWVSFSEVSFRHPRSNDAAVDGVTVTIGARSTILLGVNGAGKSTFLRIAAGLLRPDTGTVMRDGGVAFCPQRPIAVPGFTVAQQVGYCAWLQGVPRSGLADAIDVALERTALQPLRGRGVTAVSGGELARVSIASALAAKQQVLLLDEPSAALDPIARQEVRRVLSGLAQDGVTLVASSHSIDDLGEPYVDVIVMDRGRVEFHGTIVAFRAEAAAETAVGKLARALTARD